VETARALSATGATLFLTARDLLRAKKNLAGILEPGRVSLVEMNLDSFKSTRSGAEQILSASKGQVNILIHSAGVMGIQDYSLTEDGIEAQFSANYLGFFLLFQLLKQALLASITPDLHSRVVIVASSAHRAASAARNGNYHLTKNEYTPEAAYSNSKLATIHLANKIDRLYGSKGLHATSVHPGAIHTNISRHLPPESLEAIVKNPYVRKIMKSAEQGAATTVWAAVSKSWETRGGKYVEDCKEAERGVDDGDVFGVGWVEQTYNADEEDSLWENSLKMVGLEAKQA
jgi:NAD(P)-dependent dehydrogenase (short-subunit alcohol dehydrogenase family)